MKSAAEILDAVKAILQARENNYDNPRDNFEAIGQSFTPVLRNAHKDLPKGFEFTALDVARFMVILKMVRDANKIGLDNWDDTIGYGVCGRRIVGLELEPQELSVSYVYTGPINPVSGRRDG